MTITDKDLGLEVNIKENTKLYPTYDTRNSSKSIAGTYFIYETTVKNNRVRITDSKDKVNKPCQMTGWIDCRYIEEVDEESD